MPKQYNLNGYVLIVDGDRPRIDTFDDSEQTECDYYQGMVDGLKSFLLALCTALDGADLLEREDVRDMISDAIQTTYDAFANHIGDDDIL